MVDLVEQLKVLVQGSRQKSYWRAYQFKCLQRFLLITVGSFFLQYHILVHLTPSTSVLPFYPPFGSAFIILYLLGNATVLGLCLGGFCAYCVLGCDPIFLFGYLCADVGVAYVCARSCLTVFSSDHAVFTEITEWAHLLIYAGMACVLSSALRLLVGKQVSFQNFFSLWLGDLNAVVVFTGFFLTWISVYLGRERVLRRKVMIHDRLIWLIWGISCVLFFQNTMLLIPVIVCSIYLAKRFGLLVATAISYVVSTLFLIDVVFQPTYFLAHMGVWSYFLLPAGLFCFLLCMLYVGYVYLLSSDAIEQASAVEL